MKTKQYVKIKDRDSIPIFDCFSCDNRKYNRSMTEVMCKFKGCEYINRPYILQPETERFINRHKHVSHNS